MKPLQLLLASIVFLNLSGFAAAATEPIALFDDTTLEGWDYDSAIWRVEDGVITGGSTTEKIKQNFFIATTNRYQNFELKLKIKCSGDPATGLINSGIQIRSERVPGGSHMSGYQVDCGNNWFGKIYDEARRADVIANPVDVEALAKVVDVFGWNAYRIRAEGPRIQVWINDVLATDYTETNPHIALDGKIAPQVHSGGVALVQFKDVTVQELPPTPGAPTWESLGGLAAALKRVPPVPQQEKRIVKERLAAAAAAKFAESTATTASTPPPTEKSAPSAVATRTPPPSKKTQSARVEARTPSEELAGFTVPPGFIIELVASEEHGVINPIDLSFDDAGRLWTQTARMYPLDPFTGINFRDALRLMDDPEALANNPNFGRIQSLYKLETKGEDQILILADPTEPATGPLHVWAEGLSIPQSVLPSKDGAYVAHGSELFLLRDTDGDGKSDKTETVLSGFGFTDTHTMSHLLMRGPGRTIHFSQGALNKGLVTAVASGKQLRVDASCQVRFSLDHQDFEVVSVGPSNMWGLQLRSNGQWYGTEANDRAFSIVPFEHGTAIVGAAFQPMRPYQPLLPELHQFRVGGTGISGLAFADDLSGSFPAEWKDVAFLANSITNTINAVRIHRNANGTVEAEHLPDFLSATDDWFRPVNLEFGPDGCLYVADFYNKIISHNEVSTDHPDRDHSLGRIWRIRHESQQPRAIPNVSQATPPQLLTHLRSPSLWEKRAAWNQIGERQLTSLAPALIAMAADVKLDTVTRIHALWSLEELKHFDAPLIDQLIIAPDDDLRREAIRSLASFDIAPTAVASRMQGAIEDANVMVRSQAIRTLSDLRTSDPAVIALLINACKPALPGNELGGAYERNFERFLARMALEKFPTELRSYLKKSSRDHLPGNVLWAIQALEDGPKQDAFLGIWSEVSGQEMDSETFVGIASMFTNPKVAAALAPTFQDPAKAVSLVSLAVANQSRILSPEIVEALTPAVRQLLQSPATIALGLTAVAKLKIATLTREVAQISATQDDQYLLRLLLSAQAVNPAQNAAKFKAMAAQHTLPLDLRLEAALALAPIDEEETYRLAKAFIDAADTAQKAQIASVFSQSRPGAAILYELFEREVITSDAFDLSSAERVNQASPQNPHGKAIYAAVRERAAQQRLQAQARIQTLISFISEHPGDPANGKSIFAACLACHRVGTEGTDIAPPLDGSGHREIEALLTAIVDPDAAVEGGYGLYRITRTDGSVAEGLLEKQEPLGTTIAMMGGARVFVPLAQIQKSGFVGGRSFMPSAFGQIPPASMADLVAYIRTLKEAAPTATPR